MKELDIVVLKSSFPELHLQRGDIGAIVHSYPDAYTYEVEFATAEGNTIAVLKLTRDDIREIQENEILHARLTIA